MKGLSVIITIALLLLATHLANRLRATGSLPSRDGQKETPTASFAKAAGVQRPVRL